MIGLSRAGYCDARVARTGGYRLAVHSSCNPRPEKKSTWSHSGTLLEFRSGDSEVDLNQIDLDIDVPACGFGVRANLVCGVHDGPRDLSL